MATEVVSVDGLYSIPVFKLNLMYFSSSEFLDLFPNSKQREATCRHKTVFRMMVPKRAK
jgi:hypothetical protein